MIDLHCHFLPGLDDGAKSMDQALALARASVDNGIRRAVMTPHIQPGRFDNTSANIEASFVHFRDALLEAQIALAVDMAAEVRACPEMLRLLEQDKLPFLGEMDGYRVLLLELPHAYIPPGAEKLVNYLLRRNIRPLIAHPERNREVIRNPEKLAPFVESGCLLQITAASLLGIFGDGPLVCARALLQWDAFMVLATDAHNLEARRPLLKEGVAAAAEILGTAAALELVYQNPMRILGLPVEDKLRLVLAG